jgi:GT2 family glycosyltransferase
MGDGLTGRSDSQETGCQPEATAARVSALVVNFNTRERVLGCLSALARSIVAGGMQVVVVDNASEDGSAAAIRDDFPEACLVANTHNRGYAAANNQAYSRATGGYLLLLNPDAAVAPDAVEAMAAFLDEHPEAAAVTANLVAADGTPRPYLHEFPDPLTLLLMSGPLGKLFPAARARRGAFYQVEGRVPDRPAPVAQPPGACLMLRRRALDGMLFDERFPLLFNDVDLCRRLHRSGSIYFLPAARVLHERGEGGLKDVPETALLGSAVSAVRYFRKHEGFFPAALLFLGFSADFSYRLLAGALRRLLGRPGGLTPFHGSARQNLLRMARFLCGVSYFERWAETPSPWRRLLLRALEADLWTG